MTAILDTSFLFALTDESDRNHKRVLTTAQRINEPLVLPTAVLPEVCYLIASRLGHQAMRRFIANLTNPNLQIESIARNDIRRISDVLEQYADSELDFTDAAIVAIAERLDVRRIYTLDHRDFSIVRPANFDYFELLP